MLIAAVALGISAACLWFQITASYVKTGSVITAVRDIDAFQRLELSDIRVTEMPVKAIHPASLTRIEDVLNSYARTRICAGQVILSGHVISGIKGAGRSMDIPPGKRFMFVSANLSRAVGGLLKAGERVDFIFALRSTGYGTSGPHSATILRDVLVVDVLQDSGGELQGVLIQASPDECELLAGYLEVASVYITLGPRSSHSAAGSRETEVESGYER